jgi:hypothetical protein
VTLMRSRWCARLQQRIVGRVLVEVTESRVVEAGAVEQFGVAVGKHGDHADVHGFGRLFADYVYDVLVCSGRTSNTQDSPTRH